MPKATPSATTAAPSTATAKTSKKTKVKAKVKVKDANVKANDTIAVSSSDVAEESERSEGNEGFVEAQRAQLLAERAAYAQSASTLQAEADQLAQDREPGDVQFDEESGEGDSMNVERERDLVLSAQAMASIDEIDRALAKIDVGTYGVCERCGQPIPEERLRALPHASLCVRCKSGGLGRR